MLRKLTIFAAARLLFFQLSLMLLTALRKLVVAAEAVGLRVGSAWPVRVLRNLEPFRFWRVRIRHSVSDNALQVELANGVEEPGALASDALHYD
jgi:hypothetical protein